MKRAAVITAVFVFTLALSAVANATLTSDLVTIWTTKYTSATTAATAIANAITAYVTSYAGTISAEYVTGSADATLTAERVATDTSSVDVDTGTASQMKWNVLPAGVTLTGDVDGAASANDLDEAAVEAEIESVVDLQDCQGAVTDAQVPNTITLDWTSLQSYPSACSANQFVHTVGDTLTCAQPDHGSLAGLTDDDHAQYVAVDGRAGGQTVSGGTASGEDMTLRGSEHATNGHVNLLGGENHVVEVSDAGTATNVGMLIKHTSSGSMADNFGPRLQFVARDTDAVDNVIGQIDVDRSGADNTGRMEISVANAGTLVSEITINTSGITLDDDLAIASGGTGQSTATNAFDALAPTTTQGDLIYHNGTDNVRLAKGTAGQVLQMNSGATAPQWAALGEYRNLLMVGCSHTAGRTADTYGFRYDGSVAPVAGGSLADPLALIYIDNADYTTAGVENMLRVHATLHANNVAPTGNYTVGLYPITRPASSGGAGVLIYTIGTVVSGSTVTFTTPAADSSNQGNSGDFAIPADGYYALCFVSTATVAASAHIQLTATLQVHRP